MPTRKRCKLEKALETSVSFHSSYCEPSTLHATSVSFHSYCGPPSLHIITTLDHHNNSAGKSKTNISAIKKYPKTREELEWKVNDLESKLEDLRWSYKRIENNDPKTKFYTGLRTYQIFKWLFSHLETKARAWIGSRDARVASKTPGAIVVLPVIDQLFATLMRLRLGLFLQDLADRFQLSKSKMSIVVSNWMLLLERELKLLNPCPSRENVSLTMPPRYELMKGLRFMIDCTELQVESQSAQPSSNNKQRSDIKFLVAVSPAGLITFISDAFEGSASNSEIIQKSGFLDLLEKGDLVLVDTEFIIDDLVPTQGAVLNVPACMSGEITEQVQRSIGRVKEFRILDDVMPLSFEKRFGSIFRVCCWLSNLEDFFDFSTPK